MSRGRSVVVVVVSGGGRQLNDFDFDIDDLVKHVNRFCGNNVCSDFDGVFII
jgi:hypothetical protein